MGLILYLVILSLTSDTFHLTVFKHFRLDFVKNSEKVWYGLIYLSFISGIILILLFIFLLQNFYKSRCISKHGAK